MARLNFQSFFNWVEYTYTGEETMYSVDVASYRSIIVFIIHLNTTKMELNMNNIERYVSMRKM